MVDIWADICADEVSLGYLFPSFTFPLSQKLYTLCDGAQWTIPHGIPLGVAGLLSQALSNISLDMNSKDTIVWKAYPGKDLTFKEAWDLIRTRRDPAAWAPPVWNSIMLPRISSFAWRMMHCKTPTQDWAQSIGFSLVSRCCLYANNMESVLHLYFHCPFSTSLWN
ncbi:hypothetical protein AAC387_Pa07g1479 [Persea americana]